MQSCGNMKTLATKIGSRSDSAAAAAAGRSSWVMLNCNVNVEDGGADAETTAASCTSSGQSFSVSFGLAAPPASSVLHSDWLGGTQPTGPGDDDEYIKHLRIIAAHDDAVLIEMDVQKKNRDGYGFGCPAAHDYFLYEAGASWPPTMSLLPGCSLNTNNGTGLLRRSEDELLVAHLEFSYEAPFDNPELCVLRSGRGGCGNNWEFQRVPIVHHEEGGVVQWSAQQVDATVPVGGQFMCWVDYLAGFVLCDMVAEAPELRYVPLPVPPPETRGFDDYHRPDMKRCRNLAAAGPDAVRLVTVAPRCCCGGPGESSCARSRFAFNVTTWTLTLRMKGPMEWVKDGVLDCDELWQLPSYRCLPRVVLEYPIISSDDPDVVCFMVHGADEIVWMVEVDTRRKALWSVVRRTISSYQTDFHLPAKLHW